MIKAEAQQYEEWLTTIANTRLIYNTMSELEEMLDTNSIHSNGIKRCYGTPQKLRAAFRDLKEEVSIMTDGIVELDRFLISYRRAWRFYRAHLARKVNPDGTALELLSYIYHPKSCSGLTEKKKVFFEQIIENEINIPLLVLLILKVIPGYDSKDGDVKDMTQCYERVMGLLESFTANNMFSSTLPVITKARQAETKTRITLYSSVLEILGTYESFASGTDCYDLSVDLKQSRLDFEISGYWNECDGKNETTSFWEIESTSEIGIYEITKWYKSADLKITGIKCSMFINERLDGRVQAYILHPEAIAYRIRKVKYTDREHVWYTTDMPTENRPIHFPLSRLLPSEAWEPAIKLTRVTDEKTIHLYERWINRECEVVNPFEKYEYKFTYGLYAITNDALYIKAEEEGTFFRVPKTAYAGFERIQMGNAVGTLVMNGEWYLVFDDFLLFIRIAAEELERYGVERVNRIW